jgi:hypothetical protein
VTSTALLSRNRDCHNPQNENPRPVIDTPGILLSREGCFSEAVPPSSAEAPHAEQVDERVAPDAVAAAVVALADALRRGSAAQAVAVAGPDGPAAEVEGVPAAERRSVPVREVALRCEAAGQAGCSQLRSDVPVVCCARAGSAAEPARSQADGPCCAQPGGSAPAEARFAAPAPVADCAAPDAVRSAALEPAAYSGMDAEHSTAFVPAGCSQVGVERSGVLGPVECSAVDAERSAASAPVGPQVGVERSGHAPVDWSPAHP